MFMALKGTGRYPADKAIVASLWDWETGYWYIAEDAPGLSLRTAVVRAQRIVGLLPEKFEPRHVPLVNISDREIREGRLTRVCTTSAQYVSDGIGLIGVFARLDDGAKPTAEAMCARLVELLNGAEE